MEKQWPLEWTVGCSDNKDMSPDHFIAAGVPGAVQLDWAKAEQWGDHNYGDNWKQYRWMEDKFWTYRTELKLPQMSADDKLHFVSKGIDYRFCIRLNGEELFRQEGMFTPVDLDLTGKVKHGDVLEVVIDPAPKRADAIKGTKKEADRCFKPCVSYGWDWHPRLIPLGIWDETYLEVRPAAHIAQSAVTYELDEGLRQASVSLQVTLNQAAAGELVWRMLGPAGEVVIEQTASVSDSASVHMMSTVDEPLLWWPHDHGPQPLYTSEVYFQGQGAQDELRIERHSQRLGFRRVKLVMHEGAWNEPAEYPKSRSNPPITMEINGRSIFCKGTNWVQPDIFPGQIRSEDYRILLQLAKEAHMNLLRIWGGGIVNKPSFFEHCDEMGIMVWQEFPLACNNYPDTPDYLKVLDQESRSIITRLRSHASVVLWCGGNELFNSWSGMTDQSLALRWLNANCLELDPSTPFLMTSPVEGMAHGHYVFTNAQGEEVFQSMPKARNTAYTEFGMPSPASVATLTKYIPPDELFPPRRGTAWESHHAFDSWATNTWLVPDVIEQYFGPSETLEQLVEYGQLLQSAGYSCIYEEARRQKPRCSMALNWCYNEPWPTAANNSIIGYPAEPKPSYYAVQASCRPILASARIPKFEWKEEESFMPELWLLNDSPKRVPGGRMDAYLQLDADTRIHLLTWHFEELAPNVNRQGPTARLQLPQSTSKRMTLLLEVADRPEWNSSYTLLFTQA